MEDVLKWNPLVIFVQERYPAVVDEIRTTASWQTIDGVLYLLVIDTVARTATSSEIPLGILTALIGTPVFAIVLRETQRGIRGL